MCDKVVCDKVVCVKVACDKVVCDKVEDAEADAEAEPRRSRPVGADPRTRTPHNFVGKNITYVYKCTNMHCY